MHKIPDMVCTVCDAQLNHAGDKAEDGRTPSEGDYTICLYCSHLMVFRSDLTLRDPTAEEYQDAVDDTDLKEVLMIAEAFRERYKDVIEEKKKKRN